MTALLPYVILVIFLVRGVTLDGASIGLEFFFIPKWEKLLESKVKLKKYLCNERKLSKINFFNMKRYGLMRLFRILIRSE